MMKHFNKLLFVCMVLLATTTRALAGSDYYYFYAKLTATTSSSDEGKVAVSAAETASPVYSESSTVKHSLGTGVRGSMEPNEGNQDITLHVYAQPAAGYKFCGWSASPTRPKAFLSTDKHFAYTVKTATATAYDEAQDVSAAPSNTLQDKSVSNMDGDRWHTSTNNYRLYAYFAVLKQYFYADFLPVSEGGSYTVNGAAPARLTSDEYAETMEVALQATATAGYEFFGWYTLDDQGEKQFFNHEPATTIRVSDDMVIGADFIPLDGRAIYRGPSSSDYDLNRLARQTAEAGGGVIVLARSGTLEAGDYTIPAGVRLLVPYDEACTMQTTMATIQTGKFVTLSQYRTLTFAEGANLTIAKGASLTVAGQQLSANGGNPSGYPTGACGVIDMRAGGHIQVNGSLYCWGYIVGQNKIEGNNTQGVGTITVSNTGEVWEAFVVGDWRGGSVVYDLVGNQDKRIFPFNSYYIQNIEVPMTLYYGAQEKCVVSLYAAGEDHETDMVLIGTQNAMFELKDEHSVITKWYDATTDHTCVRMSGTAALSHLIVTLYDVPLDSKEFVLPVSSNLHLIFDDCDFNLSDDVNIQANAVLEITKTARVTVSANVYVYDKDQWDLFSMGTYYKTMDNSLTAHKIRDGKNYDDVEDGMLIVDGELVVSAAGALYTSQSGAAIISNGGGKYTLNREMPAQSSAWQVTGTSTSNLAYHEITMLPAPLRSDHDYFTAPPAFSNYTNLYERWFTTQTVAENNPDHTYNFSYVESLDNPFATTKCVYTLNTNYDGWWTNVVEDPERENTFVGEDGNLYNYTVNQAWLCLKPTDMDGFYGGSDNQMYAYDTSDNTWKTAGEADGDCLYTIGGEKKALVGNRFISVVRNTDDEAWHNTDNVDEYALRFDGCQWLAAQKIDGQKKAYRADDDIYIWYDYRWTKVEEKTPFYYTLNEQNLPVYYQYNNASDEWEIAQACVRVHTNKVSRDFMLPEDAFVAAATMQDATIQLLSDCNNVTSSMVYKTALPDNTLTIDLNGHSLSGSVDKMININSPGAVVTITDSRSGGTIRSTASANAVVSAVYVTAGTVELRGGVIEGCVNQTAYNSSSAKSVRSCGVYVAAAGTLKVYDGAVVDVQAPSYVYGIYNAGEMLMTGGSVRTEATTGAGSYAIMDALNATITGGSIEAVGNTSGVYGIQLSAATSRLEIENTQIHAAAKGATLTKAGDAIAYGIQVNKAGAEAQIKSGTEILSETLRASYSKNAYGVGLVAGTVVDIYDGVHVTATSAYQYAYAITSAGTLRVHGGEFTASAVSGYAYGANISNNTAVIDAGRFRANAGSYVYGVLANASASKGTLTQGDVTLGEGVDVEVSSTTTKTPYTYALYAQAAAANVASGDNAGDYATAATMTVNGGQYAASAKGASGYVLLGQVTKESSTASATPTLTVNGGKFLAGTKTLIINQSTVAGSTTLNGGYYSQTEDNMASLLGTGKQIIATLDAELKEAYPHQVAEAYTITFEDEDGSQLWSGLMPRGEMAVYPLETTPEKEATAQYTYTFGGWNNPLAEVTADATYRATYNATINTYTVRYLQGETELASYEVEYGAATPAYDGTPDAGAVYTFTGWSPEVAATVTEDADYEAQFEQMEGGEAVVTSAAGVVGTPTTWAKALAAQADGATITLLKDVTGLAAAQSITRSITLDLNGHTLSGTVDNMLTINGSGKTVTITDNSIEQTGRIELSVAEDANTKPVYVKVGTLTFASGTIYSENTNVYDATAKSKVATGIYVAKSQFLNVTGGKIEAYSSDFGAYGIHGVGGTINVTGGSIEAVADSANACGIYLATAANTLTVQDATVFAWAKAQKSDGTYITAGTTIGARGIYVYITGSKVYIKSGAKISAQGYYSFANYIYGLQNVKGATVYVYDGALIEGKDVYQYGYGINNAGNLYVYGGEVRVSNTKNSNVFALNNSGATCKITDEAGTGASTARFVVDTKGAVTGGIYSSKALTMIGGEINVKSTSTGSAIVGYCQYDKAATLTDTKITVNGGKGTYGVQAAGKAKSTLTQGSITLNNVDVTVTSNTASSSFGVYVNAGTAAGPYTFAGTITINGGRYDVRNTNSGAAYAAYNVGKVELDTKSATGTLTITDGLFVAKKKSSAGVCVAEKTAGTTTISGGYYSDNTNLAGFVAASKVLRTLPEEHEMKPDYSYQVTDVPFRARFLMDDGSTLIEEVDVFAGEVPVCATTPAKEASAQYTYEFSGWSPEPYAADKNQDYLAQFTPTTRQYTVVWQNADGEELARETLDYGAKPQYTGATPVLASTTSEVYTFAGKWQRKGGAAYAADALPTVAGDETYVAVFDATERLYDITFINYDNSVIGDVLHLPYNAMPTAPTAVREADSEFQYNFSGWAPTLGKVQKNQTYKAQYTKRALGFIITFRNIDGTIVSQQEWAAGSVPACVSPTYPGAVFYGWNPAVTTVTAPQTYDAVFYMPNKNGDHAHYLSSDPSQLFVYCEGVWAPVVANEDASSRATYPYVNPDDETLKYVYTNGQWEMHEVIWLTEGSRKEIAKSTTFEEVNVQLGGYLKVSKDAVLTTDVLTIQASENESGQICNIDDSSNGTVTVNEAGYFEFIFEQAASMRWYALGVPFKVDGSTVTDQIGRTLTLDREFDIIYYDGAARAANGLSDDNWRYLADDADQTLVPGKMYMIGFARGIAPSKVRFTMNEILPMKLKNPTYRQITLNKNASANGLDAGWNAIANPMLSYAEFHRLSYFVPTDKAQIYDSETDSYDMIDITATLPVGKAVVVQVDRGVTNQYIDSKPTGTPFMAPRRTVVDAEPEDSVVRRDEYVLSLAREGQPSTATIAVAADTEAADEYVIGQDLQLAGLSQRVAQMWINRYGTQLCMNTTPLQDNQATYPLGLFAPAGGEYTLEAVQLPDPEWNLYLTYLDKPLWNLAMDAYTLWLDKGNTYDYGLRLVGPKHVSTDIDEVINTQTQVRKVMRDGVLYIQRGEHIYDAQGKQVK